MSRVGEFTTLGKVSTSITSGSRGWARYYAVDGALFLRMTNLPREGVRMRMGDLAYVRLPSGLAEAERTRVQRDDVLISITAELGKIGLVDNGPVDAFVNQHLACIRPDPRMADSRYLAYYLASPDPRKRFQRLNDAGAKAGLNLKTLDNFRIALPPLDEQRRIARILATWDTAIEKTERLIRAKLAQRVWMSKSLVDGDSARGCEGGCRRVRFGDVARVGGTQVDPKVEPFRSMLHIGPENVISGTGQIRGLLTAGELKLVSGKHLFDDRSIVYSRIRPYLNKVCFPKFSGLCSSEMYPITVDSQVALPEYITILMLGPSFLSEAIHRTSGTGLPRVSRDDLASIRINLPRSLEGQQQVARWFSGADRELELLEQRIRMLRAQQAAMSARLMSFSATGRGVA